MEYRMEMLKIEHKGYLGIYLATFVMIRYTGTENYDKKFNS